MSHKALRNRSLTLIVSRRAASGALQYSILNVVYKVAEKESGDTESLNLISRAGCC